MKRSTRSRNKATLERDLTDLTQFSQWEWRRFRRVLITLAALGTGRYVPAFRRPEMVNINGLRELINELNELSRLREGRETSRAVFVDHGEMILVFGKRHTGSPSEGRLVLETQPGRENFQVPVLTVHIHPPNLYTAHGLSDVDYTTFLSDERQIAMMISWGSGTLFSLKTTATPSQIQDDVTRNRVSTLRNDFLGNLQDRTAARIVEFNKAVCREFGLTLYLAQLPDPDNAKRVEVTR